MKYLHITQQGTTLKKLGEMLIIEQGKKTIEKIHTEKLTDIYLYGNINLTQGVIRFALLNNINITFLTSYGRYIGKLVGENKGNVKLRIEQFKKFTDEEFKKNISKKIVNAKLMNYKTLLSRLNRKLKKEEIAKVIHSIRLLLNKLEEAKSIEEIMGIEGKGSANYFSMFNYFLNGKFVFVKRSRRPPLDPVNVMLSFGYTMLYNIIVSLLYAAGLDPMLGNFHSVEYGRNSLALDLMEEFRPIIVDTFVINLIVRNIITPAHFTVDNENNYPCVFTNDGKKLFIEEFEKKLDKRIKYLKEEMLIPYRKIIELQVDNYRKLIMDEIKEYNGIIIR